MKSKKAQITLSALVLAMAVLVPATALLAQEVSVAGGPAKVASSMPDYTRYSVRDLVANPPARGIKVETYGTTDIVASPKRGKASSFILKGDEGGSITIESNSALPPTPGTRKDPLYATVQYEPGADGVLVPFLIEALDVSMRAGLTRAAEAASSAATPAAAPEKSFIEKYQYPLIAGALVLVAGILLMQRSGSAPRSTASVTPVAPPPPPLPSRMPPPPPQAPSAGEGDGDDEITIRKTDVVVRVHEEATREFFPFHLIIKSGFGDGTQIPLCSSVGGGRTITIGRRKKGSPTGASFIGLEDQTHALSGQQVKLTYDKASRKVLLENQSAANPTSIDSRPLAAGETLTIKPGMRIGLPPNYDLEVREGAYFPFGN